MGISSATSRANYTGDGATTVFAYSFKIIVNTDLLVTTRNPTTGTETTKVLTTDYTVSGVGAAAGGNVTFGSAPTDLHLISIRRVRALTQTTGIRNQGAQYAETHEDSFDHLVMLSQQLQDQITRSLRLPETEAGTAAKCVLPALTQRASKYVWFNASSELELTSSVDSLKRTVRQVADQTATTATLANCTNCFFSVAADKTYKFTFTVIFRSSVDTVGLKVGLTFPAVTVFTGTAYTNVSSGDITASGGSYSSASVPLVDTNYYAEVSGVIRPSAAGTVQLQFAAETTGATVTFKANSVGEIYEFA